MKTMAHKQIATGQGADSGFRFMDGKALMLFMGLALAVLLLFYLLSSFSFSFSFQPPKAYASIGAMASGLDQSAHAFTASEKRYMLQAVAQNPENIIKLDGYGVRAVFDEPDLVRADLPTVVWQYRTDACVLDIYFHSDQRDADHALAVHYETRSRETQTRAADEACMADFVPSALGPRMVSVSAFYKSYIN